ncbi:MAG: hypothetical protein FJ126_01140 [Deltaproteobacteria bacterium]|nr:hypothetical protein [Deltaproteobacteria bacterium]
MKRINRKTFAWGLAILLALAPAALAQTQMVAWDGSHWKDLTQELKVAYVLGIGNMASFETAMGGSGRAVCISKAFVDELKTKTVGQVVTEVDQYYKEKPDRAKVPVIDVILQRCTKLCAADPPKEKKP